MNEQNTSLTIDNSILLEIIEIQNEVVQAGLNIEQITFLVANRAQKLVKAQGAVVELKEEDDMVYRATSGSVENQLGLRLKSNGSLSGLCVKEAKAQICFDSETDERVDRAACRKVGLRSMIVVPLIYKDEAIGVLKVLSEFPNSFSSKDANILNMLTKIISAALYTAEKLGNNELYIASTTDIMTGIKNRSFFYDILRTMFISSLESRKWFTVFMIDMDNLKKINDTFGHKYGDDSIIELVKRIKKVLREQDIFSRIGGDEFAIIFNTIHTKEKANILVQRISDSIEADFFIKGKKIELSASIGYSILNKNTKDIQELINSADIEMYKKKKENKLNEII